MKIKLYKIVNALIAAVWFVNGLFCKVLNLAPRHEEIVAKILLIESPRVFTIMIGIAEIIMAAWILSGYKHKLNALTQMVIIATMNIIEFLIVPELLMWGKLNSVFSLLFILLIGCNEFILNRKST